MSEFTPFIGEGISKEDFNEHLESVYDDEKLYFYEKWMMDNSGNKYMVYYPMDEEVEKEELKIAIECLDFTGEIIEIPGAFKTFDVYFNDNRDSNNKGFKESLAYCKGYIEAYNGSNTSYFEDYKGGTVSIVCNQTGETIFETEIKS